MAFAIPSARGLVKAITGKHPESEYEMAVNRIVIITSLFAAAILVGYSSGAFDLRHISSLYALYVCSGLVLVAHINAKPKAFRARRVYSMSVDIVLLSYVSWTIGPVGIGFLYPAYLLIIYGYGFRFGPRWLTASAALSVACVALVVAVSPVWRANGFMSGGLLVGLVITPIYAHKLVRKLWRAKAQAEESSRAKSMFIAAVSHDLRTPLNAIIGLGDILAASKSSAEDADMARMIGDAGRSLLGQIDSILDFSRLEMGRDRLSVERVDLIGMLYGVRELLDVSAQAKGVRLELKLEMPVPRHIVTSPRHIKDSLVNLVGNAIKFTAQGAVVIEVSAAGRANGRSLVRFEVRDTGIGIKVSDQAQIFERFSQANDGIRENYGGSGLGLAICRQLVQALGGEIGVISSEGQGSTFWFEIEVDVATDEPARALSDVGAVVFSQDRKLIELTRSLGVATRVEDSLAQLEQICSVPGERLPAIILDTHLCAHLSVSTPGRAAIRERLNKSGIVLVADKDYTCCADGCTAGCSAIVRRPLDATALSDAIYLASGAGVVAPWRLAPSAGVATSQSILVAEDNKTNQKVIAKMLALSGRHATVVDDGRAALAALADKRYDIVLMDINMPVMDGVETTRRLRALERGLERRTPVIALTADVTTETRARCMSAGIDDCVTKPIDLPRLLATIDRWTGLLASEAMTDAPLAAQASPAAPPATAEPSAEAAPSQAPSGLNHAALADLEKLGGKDFVEEVAAQFVSDAALLLRSLAQAVEESDVAKFRDEAHALRSCSANVGARSIYELCLSWRAIGPQEFAAEGANHVAQLEREFVSACEQLTPYLPKVA